MVEYTTDTALLVVDVQNDFADPAGSLFVENGTAVVDAVNNEVTAADVAGASVFYTQDWHPAETPHFADYGGTWPVHCVADTWGAALHPSLDVRGPIVRKGTQGEDGYSGFTMSDPVTGSESRTALHGLLQARGVRRVIVVGLAEDVCVFATARDALGLGYEVIVLREATRPVDLQPGDGDRAMAELAEAGVTIV